MFQSRAGGAVQFDSGLFIGSHGVHEVKLTKSEVALGSERLETRSRAKFLLFLRNVEGTAGQIAGLTGRAYTGARLLESVLSVAHLNANLFLQLFHTQRRLAILQLRAILVGLRDAVPDGNVEVEADIVVRRRVVE